MRLRPHKATQEVRHRVPHFRWAFLVPQNEGGSATCAIIAAGAIIAASAITGTNAGLPGALGPSLLLLGTIEDYWKQ